MTEEALVTLELEGYVAFYGVLAIVIFALVWFLRREDQLTRKKFFEEFDVSELRMSRYKIGLVYRIVETDQDSVSIVPIWDGKTSIQNGEIRKVNQDELIPFDRNRFS